MGPRATFPPFKKKPSSWALILSDHFIKTSLPTVHNYLQLTIYIDFQYSHYVRCEPLFYYLQKLFLSSPNEQLGDTVEIGKSRWCYLKKKIGGRRLVWRQRLTKHRTWLFVSCFRLCVCSFSNFNNVCWQRSFYLYKELTLVPKPMLILCSNLSSRIVTSWRYSFPQRLCHVPCCCRGHYLLYWCVSEGRYKWPTVYSYLYWRTCVKNMEVKRKKKAYVWSMCFQVLVSTLLDRCLLRKTF